MPTSGYGIGGAVRQLGRYAVKKGVKRARKGFGDLLGRDPKALIDVLMAEAKPSAGITPAKALTNTALRSYLDKRYQRKCGVEVKQVDVLANAVALTTTLTAYVAPFTAIAQGLTDSTRTGASVEVKALRTKITVQAGAGSTAPILVRMIWVKQGKMNGAVMAASNILTTTTNIRSAYSLNADESFTILKDVTFTVSGLSAADSDGVKYIVWDYEPKSCHSITWTQADTTGVIGNMLEGNVELYWMYEGATAPTYNLWARSQWIDV